MYYIFNFFLMLLLFLNNTSAQTIFDIDTRQKVFYQSTGDPWDANKKATVAVVLNENVNDLDNLSAFIMGSSLNDQLPIFASEYNSQSKTYEHIRTPSHLRFCPNEKFINDQRVAQCTGVLIAPNIILTAGHCIKGNKIEEEANRFWRQNTYVYEYSQSSRFLENSCRKYKYVFNLIDSKFSKKSFGIKNQMFQGYEIAKSDIFECERLIYRNFGGTNDVDSPLSAGSPYILDFALIKIRPINKSTRLSKMPEHPKYNQNLNLRLVDGNTSESSNDKYNSNVEYYLNQASYYEKLMNDAIYYLQFYKNDLNQYNFYYEQVEKYRAEANRNLDLAEYEIQVSYKSSVKSKPVMEKNVNQQSGNVQAQSMEEYQKYLNNYYQQQNGKQPNVNNSSTFNVQQENRRLYTVGDFSTYDYNEYILMFNKISSHSQSQVSPSVNQNTINHFNQNTSVQNNGLISKNFIEMDILNDVNSESYLVNFSHSSGTVMVEQPAHSISKIAKPMYYNDTYFRKRAYAPIAAFSGGSGSPVFDYYSKKLRGIVVGTNSSTFLYDKNQSCLRSFNCSFDSCKNETSVVLIKEIHDYLYENFADIYRLIF